MVVLLTMRIVVLNICLKINDSAIIPLKQKGRLPYFSCGLIGIDL